MVTRLATGLVAGLFLLSLIGIAGAPQTAAQSGAGDRVSQIESFVSDQMDQSRIPGVALTIVQDGETIHSRGYGHTSDDGHEVGPDTPFIIGSTTKSITALAVMQLAEAGLIDLDAPLQTYIPWFTLADADVSARITTRHLLTMASGIPVDGGGEAFRSTVNMTPEEAVRSLREAQPSQEPGTQFEYVNANYAVLGLLIQTVSGQTYAEYVQQHIFNPLQMDHSFTDPERAKQAGFADGHRYWFGRPVSYEMPYLDAMLPAGYVISTSNDLSSYLTMLLNDGTFNGQEIVSPAGVAELTNPVHEFELGPWADGAQAWYAMGWLVGGPWGDEPTVFHPGGAPTFTVTLHVQPEQDLAVVTLTNSANFLPFPGAQEEMRQIPRGVMDILSGEEPAQTAGLNRFYLIYNLVVFVVLALQAFALARLLRVRHGLNPRRVRMTLPLVWEFGLGALMLWSPNVFDGWRHAWVWTPDLALTALVIGLLWITTAALRVLYLVLAALRQRRPAKQTAPAGHYVAPTR